MSKMSPEIRTRHRTRDLISSDPEWNGDDNCDEQMKGQYDWQIYVYNTWNGTGYGYCRYGNPYGWGFYYGTEEDCKVCWGPGPWNPPCPPPGF
jgi:hypothetical protein